MRIGWGILGAGDIARKQTAGAIGTAGNARLVAVMKRSRDRAEAFAQEFGANRAYDSVDALLADPEVDVVYVATPAHLHAEHTIAAAQAGKHVLVEKPMAMSSEQAQQMIDVCEEQGVQLMVCYYQRFNARHQKVRQLLDASAIGRVTMARARQAFFYPPQPGSWRQDPTQGGGGAVMDVGVHCIDTLRFLLGEVRAVTAFVDTLAFDYAVDDTATILLRFRDGVQAVVSAAFSVVGVDSPTLDILEVSGTKGRIWTSPIHSKDSSGALRLLTEAGEEDFSFRQSTHVALVEAFGWSIIGSKPVPVPGQEGLAGLQIVEAAYLSARTGRTVSIQ